MKIMVTGGNGFIGHTLVRHLLNEGNEVCRIHNILSKRETDGNDDAKLENIIDGSEELPTAPTEYPELRGFLDDTDDEERQQGRNDRRLHTGHSHKVTRDER